MTWADSQEVWAITHSIEVEGARKGGWRNGRRLVGKLVPYVMLLEP